MHERRTATSPHQRWTGGHVRAPASSWGVSWGPRRAEWECRPGASLGHVLLSRHREAGPSTSELARRKARWAPRVNLKPNRPIRSSEQEIPVLRAQGWGWPTRGHPANSHRNPGTSTPSCKRSQNCQDLTGIWLLLRARLSRKAPPWERACTQRGRPQAHRRTQGPGPRLLRRKAGSSRSHDGWQYARRPSANRRSPGHGARSPGRLKQTRHERRVTEAKEQAALQRKLAERRGAGLIRAEQRRAPRDPEQKRTWRGRRERTWHRKARPRKRAQTSPHAPLPAAELWPSGSGADGCRGGGGCRCGQGGVAQTAGAWFHTLKGPADRAQGHRGTQWSPASGGLTSNDGGKTHVHVAPARARPVCAGDTQHVRQVSRRESRSLGPECTCNVTTGSGAGNEATPGPQAQFRASVPTSKLLAVWLGLVRDSVGAGKPMSAGQGPPGPRPRPGARIGAPRQHEAKDTTTTTPPLPRATPPPPGGNGKWRELSRAGLVTVPRTRTDPRAAQPPTSRPGASCRERAWFGGPWLPRF